MVSLLTDPAGIRRRLDVDREWSLYALADLDPGMFEQCQWWAEGERAVALVFRGLPIRPIFVLGGAPETRALLAALPETHGYLNLLPAQLEAADGLWCYRERHTMLRMMLDRPALVAGETIPLGSSDRARVERLFAAGDGGGIAFAPWQLETGFFRGIARADGELDAVAGVHVVSSTEGVAGLGNVFTRPDLRGRGLGRIVSSAVAAALLDAGIRTVGLNVEDSNAAAIRAYEAIGFRTRFHYFEGVAERIADAPSAVCVARSFAAPPERVFDAWLDPAHTGEWLFATPTGRMVRVEIDARPGGSFLLTDRRDGEDVEHRGTWLELDRPRRLVFSFSVPKYSKDATRVAVDIAPSGGGCELTLTNEPVAAEYAERSASGWRLILDALAKTLGGC